MSNQNRITLHGKVRMKERTDFSLTNSSMSKVIYMKGKSSSFYKGAFYKYLFSKSNNNVKVKVYKNNIYIFTKNKKKLITTYPVPEKYLPLEKYERSDKIIGLISKIGCYANKPVVIKLKTNEELRGYIDYYYEEKDNLYFVLKINEEQEKIVNLEDVEDIFENTDAITNEIKNNIGIK